MPKLVAARADPYEDEMKERSYTAAEIDRMRRAVEHQWLYGSKISEHGLDGLKTSGPYMEEEKTKCIEEMLRTYILAGVDPKELE